MKLLRILGCVSLMNRDGVVKWIYLRYTYVQCTLYNCTLYNVHVQYTSVIGDVVAVRFWMCYLSG